MANLWITKFFEAADDLQLSLGARIRKSPFFDATCKSGMISATVYNHMYLPTSYGDPEAEYERLLNGVALWDVGVSGK